MLSKGYAVSRDVDGVATLNTSVTLDDAKDSVRLSYSDISYISLDARPVIDGSLSVDSSNYVTQNLMFSYSGGKWQIKVSATSANSTEYTGYDLSDKIGEWNHFTYAVKTVPVFNEETNEYCYGYSLVRLYFNGILISEDTYINKNDSRRKTADDIVPGRLTGPSRTWPRNIQWALTTSLPPTTP
jgi:hypothetical protein